MTDFTRRRLFRRGGIVAGLAAVAALAVVGSAAASAHSPTALHHASGPRPTIVLVHGAWANGSSWNGVVQRLQADGYTVDVPPNPLQGLAYDPAYLADFLHSISGPIVLVGHSYGGAVITNAATGDKQVKALVYVDAFAPDQGQTIGQLVSSVPGSCVVAADPTTLFNLATFPGAPAGVFDAYYKQSLFPSCFANGLPLSQARVLAATAEPLSTIALGQKSGVPGLEDDPLLGGGRHRRPGYPARGATGHGPARARPYHRGPRASPVHDLQSWRRHPRHPQSRARDPLTPGRLAPVAACRRPAPGGNRTGTTQRVRKGGGAMTTEDLRSPTFRWCSAGFLGAWHGLAPSRRP